MKVTTVKALQIEGYDHLFYPLEDDQGCWEWELLENNSDIGSLPHLLPMSLFCGLSGYDPDTCAAGYGSLERALDALKEAVSKATAISAEA